MGSRGWEGHSFGGQMDLDLAFDCQVLLENP